MEKRNCARTCVRINITFRCCNKEHSGTITNLSRGGMFINTDEMCFPFDSQLDVYIPSHNGNLHVPVHLSRLTMSPDYHDGIAVEMTDPPRHYLDFLNNIESSP